MRYARQGKQFGKSSQIQRLVFARQLVGNG